MILEVVINILMAIVKVIFGLITTVLSPIIAPATYFVYLAKIISICTQANNFMHFIIGDYVVILIPLVIALLIYKYTAYPILQFIRSFTSNSNN